MQIIAFFFIQFFDSLKGTNQTPSSIQTHTQIFVLLYVCYAYLLITKLLKILIFAHGEHKKKNNKNVKLYFSCFFVHSQYNVIMIVNIGEDSISW
jgi:hypothetical protein